MIKKTITYEDFNGKEVTEDLYFNLTEAEISDMELTSDYADGFAEYIQRAIDSQDKKVLASMFKEIILKSYGKRSDNGLAFYKEDVNGPLRNEFQYSAAFNELYMTLLTDEKEAANFFNNVIPTKKIEARMNKLKASNPTIIK